MNNSRFVVDISSLCRWTGSPTGMIRTEHEVARHALENRPDCRFTFYDSHRGSFVEIRRDWVPTLIGYAGLLLGQERISGKVSWRPIPTRRVMFLNLESRRVRAESRLAKAGLGLLQRLICIGKQLPYQLHDRNGQRLDLVRYEDAIAGDLSLGAGDVLFLPSSDWWHKTETDIANIVTSAKRGLKIVAVCYDILPLIRPDWFGEPAGSGEDIKRFKAYWLGIFPHARRIVVNSRRVRQDVITYCAEQSIPLQTVDLVPLGSDSSKASTSVGRLPAGLEPGKFILYVSTIEPRKNHAHLLKCWRRLLDEGVPQRHGFKLVLVGRSGWNRDGVLAALNDRDFHQGTICHFEQIDDGALEALYAACCFCVYPSEYEGFGLPIIEAFARMKAVVASNGGSLPEVVGEFSPLLDPHDEDAWTSILRLWIEDPASRLAYEKAIAGRGQVSNWAQVGSRLIELAEAD